MSVGIPDHRAETNTCQFRENQKRKSSFSLYPQEAPLRRRQPTGVRPQADPLTFLFEPSAQGSKFREEHAVSRVRRCAWDQPGRMPASHQDYTQTGDPETEMTTKARTNVHSGVNAILCPRGNTGHIELGFPRRRGCSPPLPRPSLVQKKTSWLRQEHSGTEGQYQPTDNRGQSHRGCGIRHGARGWPRLSPPDSTSNPVIYVCLQAWHRNLSGAKSRRTQTHTHQEM